MLSVKILSENELLETNEKVFGCIYEIISNIDGKKYIGQTVVIEKIKVNIVHLELKDDLRIILVKH